jgi:hypothetical protein
MPLEFHVDGQGQILPDQVAYYPTMVVLDDLTLLGGNDPL